MDPADVWASRDFHIKWKRYAYIHTSWETRETLSKLGGYKRITNYIKRSSNHQVRTQDTLTPPPFPRCNQALLISRAMSGPREHPMSGSELGSSRETTRGIPVHSRLHGVLESAWPTASDTPGG